MIQQVKLIYKKSYDELEDAINAFLKEVSTEGVTVDTVIAAADGNLVAVVRYMKNPL
jgi:hypothetical protein